MKWWLSENECTGCLACENICQNNAITVMPDRDGFLYPVIDNTLCVNCG
ncbi:MAG: 4Fe-4S binding protein, partial [Lachnospiraceae bacterium]|nr:4Fe-4S binding protein [Lachnospiraceae bacterium]